MPTLEQAPHMTAEPIVDQQLPGQPMPDWMLFDPKFQSGKEIGFRDPDGKYFPLAEGDTLVQYRSDEGGRDTFILSSKGVIPFQEWGPKIVSDNLEQLRSKGEVGEHFANLYKVALAEDPRLESVIINPSGSAANKVLSKTGGYAAHQGSTASGKYEVTINTEDGWGHFDNLLRTRERSADISAQKMGIDPSQMDSKLLASFIFLHELGHVVDYMDNAPDLAIDEMRRKRDMDTLPWAGWDPATMANYFEGEEGKAYWNQNGEALKAAGIITPEALVQLQEERYHSIETEDNPDQFAVRVLAKANLLPKAA